LTDTTDYHAIKFLCYRPNRLVNKPRTGIFHLESAGENTVQKVIFLWSASVLYGLFDAPTILAG